MVRLKRGNRMISNSRQDWTVGATVRVGFVTLRVMAIEATPGDYKPDAYRLESMDGKKQYRFVPHFGLERIEP